MRAFRLIIVNFGVNQLYMCNFIQRTCGVNFSLYNQRTEPITIIIYQTKFYHEQKIMCPNDGRHVGLYSLG
jgi:hypothetical protein